jgi:7-cyano-7-deazaguanine synthase in queuosine biosynthesis
MIWQVACRMGEDDHFEPPSHGTANTVYMVLNASRNDNAIESNVTSVLQRARISPPPIALDLLRLAMIAYSSDRRILRKAAYNGWERGFRIFLPVSKVSVWEPTRSIVEQMLGFLTSDHWELEFRETQADLAQRAKQGTMREFGSPISAVALLSGGLDSFAGAVDLLGTHTDTIAFVSRYGRGNVTNAVQGRVYSLLEKCYPSRSKSLRFFVQPRKSITGCTEPSSRSRSVLFLALGTAVASGIRSANQLYISENGFMSLNVPMASNRIASLSTRTTHPHFLRMFQDLLDNLNIEVHVENPYQFVTKGEMLSNTPNMEVMENGIGMTRSCSKSTQLRYMGISPYAHCGYCLSCIVRRAAIYGAGIRDTTEYSRDVLQNPKGEDLRAVKAAIRRSELIEGPLVFDVLKSGPLADSHKQYADVYRRGLLEIKGFLHQG